MNNKTKDYKIACVLIIICVLCAIIAIGIIMYNQPHIMRAPQIKMDKEITDTWIIFNVSKIENREYTEVTDFKLAIGNESDIIMWPLTDIENSISGPKFVDNDNDGRLTSGDSFFIPIEMSGTNKTIVIYHIPFDAASYEGDL